MAQHATALESRNPMYANTLGVAFYRAGVYREAVRTLLANLEGQDDRFLPWDLCFLAMSFHQLGEHDRATEYRNWALRWSRDQKRLSADYLRELSIVREEMKSTLRAPPRAKAPAEPGPAVAPSRR